MLDLRRSHESKAGLVKEKLLINVSKIPNWRDEWKTTRNKRLNESTMTAVS